VPCWGVRGEVTKAIINQYKIRMIWRYVACCRDLTEGAINAVYI